MRIWAGVIVLAGAAYLWSLDLPLVGDWSAGGDVLTMVHGPAAAALPTQEPYASTIGTWPQTDEQRLQIITGVDAYNAADYTTAKEILLPLAESGHAWAQFMLARAYGEDSHDDPKSKKAFHWYKKSAEQYLAEAQNSLGYMYDKGEGTNANSKLGVHWYKKAAKQSLPKAEYNLGYSYKNGDGVTINREKAMSWFTGAAKGGYRDAQLTLGLLLRDKDKTKAHYWLRMAGSQGDKIALAVLAADGDQEANQMITLANKTCVMIMISLLKQWDYECDW